MKRDFIRGNARHYRPDIRLALFDKATGKLLSAMIVEVKCRKAVYLYSPLADTLVIEHLDDYYSLRFYDSEEKESKMGIINSVVVIYPKQNKPIPYEGENNYSFIEMEPADEGIQPYGYDKLKEKVEEFLVYK